MSILPIYNCFHPILKIKTEPVKEINDDIKNLIADMFETMDNTGNGVGLAANQVGKSLSIFVINVSELEEYPDITPFACINPEILEYSNDTVTISEGCLSSPELYQDIERPNSIKIKYYDHEMNEIVKTFDGFLARVLQHEYDHLQGILFFEKLSNFKQTLIKNKLNKIKNSKYDIDYNMINYNGTLKKSTWDKIDE